MLLSIKQQQALYQRQNNNSMVTYTNEESYVGQKMKLARPSNAHDYHPSPEMWKNKGLMRNCYVGVKKVPRKSLIEHSINRSPAKLVHEKKKADLSKQYLESTNTIVRGIA